MRIIFMGSPAFAVPSLRAATRAGEVVAVVTQPDRPAGRGNVLAEPAVKRAAREQGIPVMQPAKVRTPEFAEALRALSPDVILVAAYGRILVPAVLELPRAACLNVHASLLPRWRGASPVTRAIAAGDKTTGVCLMRMQAGLDTGPVYARVEVPIGAEDTTDSLEEALALAGASLVEDRIEAVVRGELPAVPQSEEGVTLAPPLDKVDGRTDWTRPAALIRDHVRAMFSWPCAFTEVPCGGAQAEIWKIFPGVRVEPSERRWPPGVVIDLGREVRIATGSGLLVLADVLRPGRKRMRAADAFRGARIGAGARIGGSP